MSSIIQNYYQNLRTNTMESKEEAEIDRTSTRTCYACMYALYGLSEDEIKIVEGI